MRCDAETLARVERGQDPATLRFFRFAAPTVSYGRLQKRSVLEPIIPPGWSAVQRPTGGGLVYHQDDLCLSLCWPRGQAPIPLRAREQYRWIHSVILEALGTGPRMASCRDEKTVQAAFDLRDCFTHPVGFDLMQGSQKIVGGALVVHRDAILYQGSILAPGQTDLEERLRRAFQRVFN
jgi:lipoate-protein ligase A